MIHYIQTDLEGPWDKDLVVTWAEAALSAETKMDAVSLPKPLDSQDVSDIQL